MRSFRWHAVAAAFSLIAFCSSPASAGWGSRRCSSGGCSIPARRVGPDSYMGWATRPDGSKVRYVNGTVVETKREDSPAVAPPSTPAAEPIGQAEPIGEAQPIIGQVTDNWQTSGVDASRLSREERVVHGGRVVDGRAFFAGPMPDDKQKPYIAVVGNEQFHKQAKELFAGTLAATADKFAIGYFAPTDWHVTEVGIARPGVHVFGARNSADKAAEVHFQEDLVDLEKPLAQALRERDQSFDPAKVPDLRKPKPLVDGKGVMDWINSLVGQIPGGWLTIIAALILFPNQRNAIWERIRQFFKSLLAPPPAPPAIAADADVLKEIRDELKSLRPKEASPATK